MTLLMMAICTVLFENRYNLFFFQNVQTNDIFQIFKMFKNNNRINIYYTKSKSL